jgi:hypothetical protein
MHSGLVQGATLGREPLCFPGEGPPCIVSMCVALPYAIACKLSTVLFRLKMSHLQPEGFRSAAA